MTMVNECEVCGCASEEVTNNHQFYTADYLCPDCIEWHEQDEFDNMMKD